MYFVGGIPFNYNDKGNLIEVVQNNQPTITYLWSYRNSLPIAEIKNATYSELESALNQLPLIQFEGSDGEPVDEETMRSKLELLRQRLPNALVSSFTHKPLEGVSSITDPTGKASYFQYDDLARLKLVKDEDGNIVKAYEYHYKTP